MICFQGIEALEYYIDPAAEVPLDDPGKKSEEPTSGSGASAPSPVVPGQSSGLQWANLFTRGEPDDPLTMGAVWLMFLFDCLLFSLIILYIDTVAPGKFGVARPWYFPVMGLCRNGTVTSEEVSPRRLDDDMFEVEPSGEAGVRVKHLRKEFPRWGQDPVKAVQDVSFAAFPGNITLPSWASTCADTSATPPITNHRPYYL